METEKAEEAKVPRRLEPDDKVAMREDEDAIITANGTKIRRIRAGTPAWVTAMEEVEELLATGGDLNQTQWKG